MIQAPKLGHNQLGTSRPGYVFVTGITNKCDDVEEFDLERLHPSVPIAEMRHVNEAACNLGSSVMRMGSC